MTWPKKQQSRRFGAVGFVESTCPGGQEGQDTTKFYKLNAEAREARIEELSKRLLSADFDLRGRRAAFLEAVRLQALRPQIPKKNGRICVRKAAAGKRPSTTGVKRDTGLVREATQRPPAAKRASACDNRSTEGATS